MWLPSMARAGYIENNPFRHIDFYVLRQKIHNMNVINNISTRMLTVLKKKKCLGDLNLTVSYLLGVLEDLILQT